MSLSSPLAPLRALSSPGRFSRCRRFIFWDWRLQFYQIFLSSLFGGLLGIVLLIPFRKYFVKDMQGRYPFPEATATTEVLVSGEKKGNQAKLLAVSGLIGGLYDFVVSTFGWWTEEISTRIMQWGTVLADKTKLVFKVNTGRGGCWGSATSWG